MTTRLVFASALATWVLSASMPAQSFLNGDFEQHTFGGCTFNLTNNLFSAGMVGCSGYGLGGSLAGGEIDVMDGSCTAYTPPGPVGTTRVGLAANSSTGGFDAMTMQLTSPLVVGTSYTVSFWGYSAVTAFSFGPGQIAIGTSAVAGAAGTTVGTSDLLDTDGWRLRQVTFTATAADSHISVVAAMQAFRTWDWVDGFEIHVAQSAWCTQVNGHGTNPMACSCFLPPTLGAAWGIDVAPTANTLLTLLYLSLEPLAPLPLPFGELLINSPVVSVPGFQAHVAPMPVSPLLVGIPLHAQGALVENGPVGIDIVLTNALVGVIGF